MTTDLRRSQRYALSLPVEAVVGAHQDSFQAVSENISGNGIYFVSPQPLAADERILFIVTLAQNTFRPARTRIHCRGRVVRVDPRGASFGIAAMIDQYYFE
jgi:hypothetical protein